MLQVIENLTILGVPAKIIIATNPRVKFLKGIKHVITTYKEFSDNKKWFDWKEDIICQAQAQAVSDYLMSSRYI